MSDADTTTWAIAWPWSEGANIRLRPRLIITDVPADVTDREILAWVDDPSDFDRAVPEAEWGSDIQLQADDTPRVRWRGRPGRPSIGRKIELHIEPDLLEQIEAAAEEAGETRSAAIRRLLRQALAATPAA